MATSFTQTDLFNITCARDPYCSAEVDLLATVKRDAVDGGTAGSTEVTLNMQAGETVGNSTWFFVDSIDDFDGASGDWTCRLNVTTANSDVDIEAIYICRLNSSCVSQETIGSLTAIGTTLTAGVKTHTVTQSASVTISAGDIVAIIYVLTKITGTFELFGITPDQDIDSPWSAGNPSIVADSGSYVLTGQDATLIPPLVGVVAGSGSYIWTGQDADLRPPLRLTALNGSYSWNGFPAILKKRTSFLARLTVTSKLRRRFYMDLEGFDTMWVDKNAIEDIDIDWSRKLGIDTISTSTFTGEGITVTNPTNSTTIASVTISAVSGEDNKLINHIVTSTGEEFDKTIKVNERET